jgi:predicted RNase H-like HicB family nuclease
MAHYIALIRKEPGSDYGVSFPDFPGCVTAGADLSEAAAFAQEALALHIEGMIEEGLEIPAPSALEDVMADPENAGAVAILVPAPAPKPRAVRLSITLDEGLLAEIDRAAARSGFSRSGFLAEGARRLIAAESAAPATGRRDRSARNAPPRRKRA